MHLNLELEIFKPQKLLADYVQAIWSVSVEPNAEQTECKQLFSDAGTGVVFILRNDVQIEGDWQVPGVLLTPVSTLAQQINLPPRTVMAGVRFHPAVGYQLFGQRLEQALRIEENHPLAALTLPTLLSLQTARSSSARMSILYRWAQTLIAKCEPHQVGHIIDKPFGAISQRQRERIFQKWLGITPKHYQRIKRVKQTFEQLRTQPDTVLSVLALEQGFADQAHMTRECKQIGCVTPKQFVRKRQR